MLAGCSPFVVGDQVDVGQLSLAHSPKDHRDRVLGGGRALLDKSEIILVRMLKTNYDKQLAV